MDVTIKKGGLNLTNCIEDGEGLFGGKSYRPKCPNCGHKSKNTFCYTGAPDFSNQFLCRSCGEAYTISISPVDSISFDEKNTIIAKENLVVPIPDGYKASNASCDEADPNAGFCYIVPEDYDLDKNHINAKPFSFAVSQINALNGQLIPNPENKGIQYSDLLKYILVQLDSINTDDVDDILDFDISDNCVALFEPIFDESDMTWIKFKGCICAGSDIRFFHMFKNYDKPIKNDIDDEFTLLINVLKQWLKGIDYTGEIKFAE